MGIISIGSAGAKVVENKSEAVASVVRTFVVRSPSVSEIRSVNTTGAEAIEGISELIVAVVETFESSSLSILGL
jgi:hypothetical protein